MILKKLELQSGWVRIVYESASGHLQTRRFCSFNALLAWAHASHDWIASRSASSLRETWNIDKKLRLDFFHAILSSFLDGGEIIWSQAAIPVLEASQLQTTPKIPYPSLDEGTLK